MPNIVRTGGGTVTPPLTHLYNLGDEATILTGGWAIGYSGGTGSQSKTADHLQLSASASSTYWRTYVTTSTINFTNITTLYFDINVTSAASDNGLYLIVGSTANGITTVASKIINTANSTRTIYTLDVTALNSSYYLSVAARGGNAETTASVYKIWY